MRQWNRWQFWPTMAAGLVATLGSTMTHDTPGLAMLMMAGPAVLMIAFGFVGLLSVIEPRLAPAGWVVAVLGAILFIAPWVAGFADQAPSAWTSWVCGGVGIVVGLWAEASARRAHLTPRIEHYHLRSHGPRHPRPA